MNNKHTNNPDPQQAITKHNGSVPPPTNVYQFAKFTLCCAAISRPPHEQTDINNRRFIQKQRPI